MWGNSTHFWVLNYDNGGVGAGPNKIFVYTRSGSRVSSMDIDLVSDNSDPGGIWSNGTTMWVSDITDNKYYAYMLSSGVRNTANEFDLDSANGTPYGTWGDGEHLFNVDWVDDQLQTCLLYTSPSPRDRTRSRMPSSA